MYALHESGKTGELRKWICIYLLQRDQGYGWGYKDIDESMGPVQKECPVSYLDEADEATHQFAKEWRAEVRAIAAARAKIRPKVHEMWKLHAGCTVKQVRITSLRPLRGMANGCLYKLKRRHLKERAADA